MGKYIIKRLAYLIPILLVVSFIVFSLSKLAPGDPARIIAESKYEHPTHYEIELTRQEYGLDQPFMTQYYQWSQKALQGDFGESYTSGRPAIEEIIDAAPQTIELAVIAFILLIVIAIPVGLLSAIYQGSLFDKCIEILAFISVSMPSFWIGLMLLYLFGVKFMLIPVVGGKGIKLMLVAALTLDIGYFGVMTRLVRVNMIHILKKDFVKALKGRYIPQWRIVLIHGLKNSAIPIVTQLGFAIISFVCGSAIVESIFSINGLGELVLSAVKSTDMPVMQAFILILSTFVVVVNLVVDLLYKWIDKRMEIGR